MIRKTFFLLTLTLFIVRPNSFGQANSFDKADKDLTSLYSKIFPFYYGNNDSLNYYSELFSTRLSTFIKNNPATLNYKFKSLTDSNACHIVTSGDGLLRIYSWDTWLGGTMHNFNNIFQFKSSNKIHSTDLKKNEGDFGTYFTDIFALKTNLKTYYLAVSGGSESTKDAYETISVYAISNDTLNDKIKLIKTQSGLNNSISFEYDFFSVVDRPERPIRLIKYDSANKIIYIPLVLENGRVTDKYILYQFTGHLFERKKSNYNSNTESSIQVVDKIFKSYIKYSESTDLTQNKELMTNALKSLLQSSSNKDLGLLINVWMYYDPTDFPTRQLIEPIFNKNKSAVLIAIDNRLKNKKKWEDKETAPYSDLILLKKQILKNKQL